MTERSPDQQEITKCIANLREIEDEIKQHAYRITKLIEQQNTLIKEIKEPNDRWTCSTIFLNTVKPYEANLHIVDNNRLYYMRSQFYHVGMKYLKFLHPKSSDIPHKIYASDFDDYNCYFITDISQEMFQQIRIYIDEQYMNYKIYRNNPQNYDCERYENGCYIRISQRKYPLLDYYKYEENDENYYFNENQDLISDEWVWKIWFDNDFMFDVDYDRLDEILRENGYAKYE